MISGEFRVLRFSLSLRTPPPTGRSRSCSHALSLSPPKINKHILKKEKNRKGSFAGGDRLDGERQRTSGPTLSFLLQAHGLWFMFCSNTPGFSPRGRKLTLREGKGLPGVTQQAGGEGNYDPEAPSPGAEPGGQGCLGDLLTPLPAADGVGGAPGSPPGHFLLLSTRPLSHPPGLPGPQPLIPAEKETAPGWLGPKPAPGNWVSGMLMVMLMERLGAPAPWLLGEGRPRAAWGSPQRCRRQQPFLGNQTNSKPRLPLPPTSVTLGKA